MAQLVTIATFQHATEADVMRLLLQEQGFEVFIADDQTVGMDWFLSNAIGGVKLQVPQAKANLAAKFVAGHRDRMQAKQTPTDDNAPDIVFQCEECGTIISFPAHRRGGVETCPYCREYVDVPD